jgi:hypothetical protein
LHARAATVYDALAAFGRLPGVAPSRAGAADGMYFVIELAGRVPPVLARQ